MSRRAPTRGRRGTTDLNRILEFTPSTEESSIPRILLLVHQAVDENFPAAEDAGRQFSKTIFSDETVEKTAGDNSPEDEILNAVGTPTGPAKDGATAASPQGLSRTIEHVIPPYPPGAGAKIPPPPKPKEPSRELPPKVPTVEIPSARSEIEPPQSVALLSSENPKSLEDRNNPAPRPNMTSDERPATEVDWTTRITLALLLAGVMLLAYVVLG
jgi:hypothetical protein